MNATWLSPITGKRCGRAGRPPKVDAIMQAKIRELVPYVPYSGIARMLGLDRGTVARYA